jgi:lipopolysaccharide biosynthesis glycosyltransferase
MQIKAV